MGKNSATILIAMIVAGCATPEQRAAKNVSEMESMVQIYGPACERLGFAPKTDQWRECILKLDAKDDLERYSDFYPHGYGHRPYWR